MMSPRHFVRLSRLAKNPPGRRRMIVMAIMLGISFLIAGLEKWDIWPDWATADRSRKIHTTTVPTDGSQSGD
ncbi:hypothetical protein [Chachezhania sediminis]|uniref:hypothetical protein n=1 Tax=Chachezhania sediminis TaxID=2599291 RepID=UPI00131BD741|nr:hypothetical protein [Chachezhania sediminis]